MVIKFLKSLYNDLQLKMLNFRIQVLCCLCVYDTTLSKVVILTRTYNFIIFLIFFKSNSKSSKVTHLLSDDKVKNQMFHTLVYKVLFLIVVKVNL